MMSFVRGLIAAVLVLVLVLVHHVELVNANVEGEISILHYCICHSITRLFDSYHFLNLGVLSIIDLTNLSLNFRIFRLLNLVIKST